MKDNKLTQINELKVDKDFIYDVVMEINNKLTHLEDATLDNRKLIAKLVKQGNTIVQFLKEFEISEFSPEELEIVDKSMFQDESLNEDKKLESIRSFIDTYIESRDKLSELEEELKKYKNQITPGQVGEA